MSLLKQALAKSAQSRLETSNAGVEVLALDMLDIENEGNEILKNVGEIETAIVSMESLDNIIAFKENLVADGKGLDPTGAAMASVAMESICLTLGFPIDSEGTPSMEDYEHSPEVATSISLEADKGMFGKAWDAITSVVNTIIKAIKDFAAKVMLKLTPVKKMAESVISKADTYSKEGYIADEVDFENDGLVSKFSALMINGGKKELTAAVVADAQNFAGASLNLTAIDAFSKRISGVKTVKDVMKALSLPNASLSTKYKFNLDMVKDGVSTLEYPGRTIDDQQALSGYGEKLSGMVSTLSTEAPSDAVLKKYADNGLGKEAATAFLTEVDKAVTIDVDVSGIAKGAKVTIGGLAVFSPMMKDTIKASGAIAKELATTQKAFDGIDKSMVTMGKTMNDINGSPEKKEAAQVISTYARKAVLPRSIAYSSLVTTISLNVLKAGLAQIAYCNACLAKYKKA